MIIKRSISQEKEWLFADGSLPIQLRIVQPGDFKAINHYHKTMYEYFLVLCGSAQVSVAGKNHKLGKGDLLVVEPGEAHKIVDYSADMQMLLSMPPPVPDDKVIVDDKI